MSGTPTPTPVDTAPAPKRIVRRDGDIARLVFALVIGLSAYGLANLEPSSARSFSSDLVRLINRLPDTGARLVVGILQLAALCAPIALCVVAIRAKWARALTAIVAAGLSALIAGFAARPLHASVPDVVTDTAARSSWVTGSAFPSGMYLAAVAAAAIVLGRRLDRKWRRIIAWTLIAVVVSRAVTGVESVFTLIAALSLGVAIGSALLIAIGFPSPTPEPEAVSDALSQSGIETTSVVAVTSLSAHGPTYRAETVGGTLFVKVADSDSRDADALARFVRWFRVKGVEDERPFGTEHLTEHEALNLGLAARAGASVPDVWAVGTIGDAGDAYLAMDWVDGQPATELGENLTNAHVQSIFAQLAHLHSARIAHRLANLDHVLIDPDGTTRFVNLGWAERGASERTRAQDLAELTTSVAISVGPERAVAGALPVFGDQLATTLPLIQPLALTDATRRGAKAVNGLLGDLREQIQQSTGAEEYQLEPLRRLSLKSVIGFVATLVIGNLLLGLVANAGEIWEAMRGANITRLPLTLLLVAFSFMAGTLSLMGAVTNRLNLWRTYQIMWAQSFLNRFTPANAGGMALRIRYLQRSGVDTMVASGSVVLTSLASGVMQVVFTVAFFAWAGSKSERAVDISLPSKEVILIVIVALFAIGGVIAFTAFGRKFIGRMKESVRTMWHELVALAKQPSKMALLFGGSFLCKIVPVLLLAQSLDAFGISIHIAQLGAMYITATTVASAAPTPGGVGAIEAALTAGLTSLGVEPATAVAVVLYFRFVTYWLTILPSWLVFRAIQKTDYV